MFLVLIPVVAHDHLERCIAVLVCVLDFDDVLHSICTKPSITSAYRHLPEEISQQ